VKSVGITVDLDLNQEVRYLGAAERKIVEILRAINLEPNVLILDEPTASFPIISKRYLRSPTASPFCETAGKWTRYKAAHCKNPI
jgi:ABC-type molybdenum transport system ATPase subunit/photorepair protein PhrA